MAIVSGKLRHRVKLQAPSGPEEGQDAYGETPDSPTTQVARWASVEPLSGRELFLAQQIKADVTHRVRMRFHPDIAPDWQIIHRGRVLNVVAVINKEEKNWELEILCREGVP